MPRTIIWTALALTVIALAGCANPRAGHETGARHDGHGGPAGMMGDMMKGRMAFSSLTPTQGNNVRGLVVFHQMDGQVMVHARLTGLRPLGEHGFHVHEAGNCASPDGSSAGGHFNPDGKPHGPQGAAHHAGDMPALKADANGVVDQKFALSGVTVDSGAAGVVGRAVIVHAQADDYTTQPTGNSGARLACGVIASH